VGEIASAATGAAPKPAKPTGKATAPPAASAAVDCSSPYTLDSAGNKKWKLECLH
jgi:hypothetical protein